MMFSLAGITLGLTVAAVLITMGTVALIPVTFGMVAVAVILAALGLGTVRRRFALPVSPRTGDLQGLTVTARR
jgi:hypothetical protein